VEIFDVKLLHNFCAAANTSVIQSRKRGGWCLQQSFFNNLFPKSHVVYFGRPKVLNTDFCNYRSTEVT
jgi:hypothetical protein